MNRNLDDWAKALGARDDDEAWALLDHLARFAMEEGEAVAELIRRIGDLPTEHADAVRCCLVVLFELNDELREVRAMFARHERGVGV